MKEVLFYFWIFMITSFFGFVVETIWCLLRNKKIESRKGLIYEHLIPIYGLTGVLLVFIIKLLNLSGIYQVFFVGVIISTIVEYISSLLQEKIFCTKSWNYTDFPLNFNGRVNMVYSILFGLISVIFYKIILIPFVKFYFKLKLNKFLIIISIFIALFFIYDCIISCIAVYRMKERKYNKVKDNRFWSYIDNKYTDEYLNKVYANMTFI